MYLAETTGGVRRGCASARWKLQTEQAFTHQCTRGRGKQAGPDSCPSHLREPTHGREIPFLSWVWGTPHTKSHTCCSSRHACVQVTSVVSRPFETPWTVAFRLLCPWDSPAGNTGVGCHALLQGIFLTQGLITSPALLGSLPVAPPGKQFSATSRKVNIVQRKPLSTALLLSALS